MKLKVSPTIARNLDLPSGKLGLAQDANAFVVERSPFPELVRGAQNREPLIEAEVMSSSHHLTLSAPSESAIGRPNDCWIGENLTQMYLTQNQNSAGLFSAR